jgi:hypothetical protein
VRSTQAVTTIARPTPKPAAADSVRSATTTSAVGALTQHAIVTAETTMPNHNTGAAARRLNLARDGAVIGVWGALSAGEVAPTHPLL